MLQNIIYNIDIEQIENIQKVMAWYFNFCSPHLTDDESINLNRTLLLIELLLAMLVTFVVHMLAELFDEESSRVKNEADPPQPMQTNDKQFEESAVSINKNSDKDDDLEKFKLTKKDNFKKKQKSNQPGFFKNNKIFFLTVQTVQNKSPCFFGHFAIAVTASAMYSPFIQQTIIGFIYIAAMILALVFEAWKFQRMLLICIAISYLSNIALITSAVTGVGMSNWDPFQITCYYSKLGM